MSLSVVSLIGIGGLFSLALWISFVWWFGERHPFGVIFPIVFFGVAFVALYSFLDVRSFCKQVELAREKELLK